MTTQRRIAFLLEETPGVYKFHIQRGNVNDPGTIDSAVDHLHVEDYNSGNTVFVSESDPSGHKQGIVKLISGTMLGRPVGGSTKAMRADDTGSIMGLTTGILFPTPIPASLIAHQHYYTGGGMEELFYWDGTRSVWLSQRTMDFMFGSTGVISAGSFPAIPNAGWSDHTWGYFSTDQLTIVGMRLAQNSPPAGSVGVEIYSDSTLLTTLAVGTATQFQRDAMNVVIPANTWINVKFIGADTGFGVHCTLICRRSHA